MDAIVNTLNETTNDTYINNHLKLLEDFNSPGIEIGPYLQVGNVTSNCGWIFDISVVRYQFIDLLTTILPPLIKCKLTFRIPANNSVLRMILDGDCGLLELGKAISIFTENTDVAKAIIPELIAITKNFKGPEIRTDSYLGGTVYCRFGTMNPIIELSENNGIRRYMTSKSGDLLEEKLEIPFSLPIGIEWPFTIPLNTYKDKDKLDPTFFKIIKPLKIDPKGNVYHALFINKFHLPAVGVVKTGFENMISDYSKRDMISRIESQFYIHSKYYKKLKLPKPYKLVKSNNTAYFFMQYIKGITLSSYEKHVNKSMHTFRFQNPKTRNLLLTSLIRTLRVIQSFHAEGIILRDPSPENFLVTNKNTIRPIDLEFSVIIPDNNNLPPFEQGTIGYISHNQSLNKTPKFEDDLYAIGGLSIAILTGLPPIIFENQPKDITIEKLVFFFGDNRLPELVQKLYNNDNIHKPSIDEIIEGLLDNAKTQPIGEFTFSDQMLHHVVSMGINGLSKAPTSISEGYWLSPIRTTRGSFDQITSSGVSFALKFGTSGVLSTISRAKLSQHDISEVKKMYQQNALSIFESGFIDSNNADLSLYSGKAGIASTITDCILSDLMYLNEATEILIKNCFREILNEPSIACGFAGQGIALLKVHKLINKEWSFHDLKCCIEKATNYIIKNNHTVKSIKKESNRRSFSYGNNGIYWFLLECYNHGHSDIPIALIKKRVDSLSFLNKYFKEKIVNYGIRSVLTYGSDEFIGYVLLLIKSFESLQVPNYKSSAEYLLELVPDYLSHNDFSQDSGMSGLGELFLEAWRVFHNISWYNKAKWITNFFIHTYKISKEQTAYWKLDSNPVVSPDLSNGTCAILHYLIRFRSPQEVGLRILT